MTIYVLNATSVGSLPSPPIVSTTALVAVLITLIVPLTVLLPSFATYAMLPEGLKATPYGYAPTPIVPTTALVAVLIILTVSLP